MTKELLKQINEARVEIRKDETLMGIVQRARNKFLAKSENQIVLFDMKDYVVKQIQWKKQSVYKNLLPLMLECSEVVCENFEQLFDKNIQTWREAVDELY